VDQIELEKEILQIRRLIELQKLRFLKDDDIKIDFHISGGTEKVRIPPMLLIPFVENAFKHGISLKETSFIHMHLAIQNKTLKFLVKNSIHPLKEQVKEYSGPHCQDQS
jgi:LytS/YehU family sensor histidine kinase